MVSTEVLIKIRKIIRSINLESKKIQKEYGVSIPQILCMEFLRDSPDFQSTQKKIRDYLNLNSSTVTGIIDRLELKGFIARLPKKGDKRITYIALTSKGAMLLEKIPPLLHDRLSKKLIHLDKTQTSKILNSLDLLIDLLEIEDIDASPLLTIEGILNDKE